MNDTDSVLEKLRRQRHVSELISMLCMLGIGLVVGLVLGRAGF